MTSLTIRSSAVVLLLVASSIVFGEDTKANTKVNVAGLRVVAPAYEDNDEMRAFNWSPGTCVSLLVVQPQGGLIGFDADASKLDEMTDDKGNSLLSKEGSGRSGFSAWPKIGEDGKAALVEIDAGNTPAAGSNAIRLKGTLVFSSASDKKTYKQDNVALKPGTKFEAGPIPMTVKEAGKPEWGDEPLEITLEANKNLDSLASVRFLDAEGNEIEASDSGSSSMTFGDEVTVNRSYKLGKMVDTATIEMTYWTDLKPLEVPFDLTITVGL